MTRDELKKEGLNKQAEELVLHRANNLHKMFGTPKDDAIQIMYNTLVRPAYSKFYPKVC